jgi:hypothetical protein
MNYPKLLGFLAGFIFWGLFVACDTSSQIPKECEAYCDQIVSWAKQCKKQALTKETCVNQYRTQDCRERQARAVNCWSEMLSWHPNIEAEFDCAKVSIPRL